MTTLCVAEKEREEEKKESSFPLIIPHIFYTALSVFSPIFHLEGGDAADAAIDMVSIYIQWSSAIRRPSVGHRPSARKVATVCGSSLALSYIHIYTCGLFSFLEIERSNFRVTWKSFFE